MDNEQSENNSGTQKGNVKAKVAEGRVHLEVDAPISSDEQPQKANLNQQQVQQNKDVSGNNTTPQSEAHSEKSQYKVTETSETPDKEKQQDNKSFTIAGYKPSEILKAPVKPPEPEIDPATPDPQKIFEKTVKTKNRITEPTDSEPLQHHKTLVVIGLALIILGLIFWPLFGPVLAILFGIFGLGATGMGVLMKS